MIQENQARPTRINIRVLYVQPGVGIGGSKLSLYGIVSHHPDDIACQIAFTKPVDKMFSDMLGSKIEKIHILHLPMWNKADIKNLIKKTYWIISGAKRGGWIIPTLKLCAIILQNHIDIVHTNNAMCPVGAFAAWLCRRPHIWHIREPIGEGSSYPLAIEDSRVVWLMNRLSAVIVCNSHFTAGIFNRFNIPTEIISNGLIMDDFFECGKRGVELRRAKTLPEKNWIVGMVGVLRANWKKHALFLEAMALVQDELPTCHFVVFGGETDLKSTAYTRALLKQAERLKLEKNLHWVGQIDDVPAIMGSLDVLVHPTAYEGSGRVVMEAMAAGKPVVGIDSGGVKELIINNETGFLVPPDNAMAIAEAVLKILRNKDMCKEMGNYGQLIAKERYAIEAMENKILKLYKSVLTWK